MYGQMTAGSWIYIGSQGIVQGTYETFVEVGRRHYGGDLAGRWILTAGLGGMGGAQPLAATMAGASMLAVECQPSRIEMRLQTGYLDAQAEDLDEALAMIEQACREQEAASRSACSATPPRSSPSWCAAACGPTSSPTRPRRTIRSTATCRRAGRSATGRAAARAIPRRVEKAAKRRWPSTSAPCSTSTSAACRRSTTATTSARWRRRRASPTPSTSPASCRPTSARSSAAASARSAGRRSPAIRRTSSAPTRR